MSGNRVITGCNNLHWYPFNSEELMEEANKNPGFEALGSITVRLQHRFQIRQTTMNRDTEIVQHDYTTRTMVTVSKELPLLCIEKFTESWVNQMFNILQVNSNEEPIDVCKSVIVNRALEWALTTRLRRLKQFGLMVYINLTTTMEIVREREELDRIEMELREQELRRILLRSKEERNLKRNPSLKRGHFEDGGGDMKNCVVCLDDFEIGLEVIWMLCSHMFHEGCLFSWLKENKSCPLCRLELTP